MHTIREECGIVGVSARKPTRFSKWLWSLTRSSVSETAFYALQALKHRGQEAAGLSFFNGKELVSRKTPGKIGEELRIIAYKTRGVHSAIGQVRYGTSGEERTPDLEKRMNEAQPFEGRGFHFVFNGNITNAEELRNELMKSGWVPKTKVDTEVITELISRELEKGLDYQKAIENTMHRLKGAFSALLLSENGSLYAFRDFWGIRPMVLGRKLGRYIIASESVALDAVNARLLREIKPGEIFHVSQSGRVESKLIQPKNVPSGRASCIFEFYYFADPRSKMRIGRKWRTAAWIREQVGMKAAPELRQKVLQVIEELRRNGHDVSEKDVIVVGVPRSGLLFAKGIAKANKWLLAPPAKEDRLPHSWFKRVIDSLKGLHYADHVAILRREAVGRTFIGPGQQKREQDAEFKYDVVVPELSGKIVVFADDSIVRNTTAPILVRKAKNIESPKFQSPYPNVPGALAVVFASSAPPVRRGCDLGIDTITGELIASKATASGKKNRHEIGDFVARESGADAVFYGKLRHILEVTGLLSRDGRYLACAACFDETPLEERIKQQKKPKRIRSLFR